MKAPTTTSASSRPRRLTPRRRVAGFTLLELMLVSALLVLVLGAAVYGLRDVTAAHARAEAYRVSASVRYLFERSVTDGVVYRLVFDLDEGKMTAERYDDTSGCGATLPLEAAVETRFKDLARKAKEREKKARERAEEEGTAPPTEGSYGGYEDFVIKPRELPKTVSFAKVATLSNPEPKEEGQIAIHFFPHGYVERAMVVVASADEQVYSIVTEPFRGAARVLTKEVDRREVFR